MTPKQALEIREFSIKWINKVVGKKKVYKQKLIDAVDELFPEDIAEGDCYDMLDCKNWDEGEAYFDSDNRKRWWGCLGDRLRELEWEDSFNLTKKGYSDLSCTLRVAVDLLIKQSGGVMGYKVGDLRKVYDGSIPQEISDLFEGGLFKAKDEEGIWL